MKHSTILITLVITLMASSCETDPLPSWNETAMKSEIINFVEQEVQSIPVEDRLAVFDMDGTIVCEAPLWLEMYCAIDDILTRGANDTIIQKDTIYHLAQAIQKNPSDTSILNNWGDHINEILLTSYSGWGNEAYVERCREIITNTNNPNYPVKLINTFYKPMLELLAYLADNQFDIYIVSGSNQGLLWSVCPQKIGFERSHLIGTRRAMEVSHLEFKLQETMLSPKNSHEGKALNIYSYTGKVPVFAFGNTTDDFGMFSYTSSNSLPNISFLLNHDDATREYEYQPWHSKNGKMDDWENHMHNNGWNIVNMSENFKTVFE